MLQSVLRASRRPGRSPAMHPTSAVRHAAFRSGGFAGYAWRGRGTHFVPRTIFRATKRADQRSWPDLPQAERRPLFRSRPTRMGSLNAAPRVSTGSVCPKIRCVRMVGRADPAALPVSRHSPASRSPRQAACEIQCMTAAGMDEPSRQCQSFPCAGPYKPFSSRLH